MYVLLHAVYIWEHKQTPPHLNPTIAYSYFDLFHRHAALEPPGGDQRGGVLFTDRRWSATAYLAKEIELLVLRGADLHQPSRAGLRLVGVDGPDPDVAQVGDIQGAVGRHGQGGGGFEAGVTGVASVAWWEQQHRVERKSVFTSKQTEQ